MPIGLPLVYEDVTISTNDDARRLAGEGRLPVLVVAERQTSGRGRRGRSFDSPMGGIYMSIATPAPEDSVSLEMLTSYVGVCICEEVEREYGINAGIKWVNDVYVGGRKLAGVLVERCDEWVVIGIGINGYSCPELKDGVLAAALIEYVPEPDLEMLCAQVVRRIVDSLQNGIDSLSTIEGCRVRSVLLGREVTYTTDGKTCRGVATDIDSSGALIVQSSAGTTRLTSSASEIRLINRSDPCA